MGDSSNKQPLKKRSLSSYLSNVSTRKEELEKIALQEKDNQEREEKERIERDKYEAEENEIFEKERIEQAKLEEERLEKDKLEEERLNKENLDKEKLEKERLEHEIIAKKRLEEEKEENERLEKEKLMKLTLEHQEPLNEEPKKQETEHNEGINDGQNISNDDGSVDSSKQITRDDKSSVDENATNTESRNPFSREELKSILKESKSKSQILLEEADEMAKEEEQEKEDFDMEGELQSDDSTEEGSPVKIRRGRLVRADKLSSSDTNLNKDILRANNSDSDSDSDLSDIDDDMKSIGISSSFLHGNSSPTKNIKIVYEKSGSSILSSPDIKKASKLAIQKNSHIAISKGQKQKKSVYRDAGGRTKLQIACDKGKYDTVQRFLEEGEIDVNDQDNAGNTPLHEAALNGHLDIVELLVKNGADINLKSYEMFQDTALIDASANGFLDVVSYLLENGADPTITNSKGTTAYEAIEDDSDLDESEQELVKEIKQKLKESTKKWNENHTHTHEDNETKSHERKRSPSGALDDDEHARSESEEVEGYDSTVMNDIPFYWNDITTNSGKQKLSRASKEGVFSYVGQYLENGGRADFKSFMESVKFGHSEITSLFLAFGSAINGTIKDNVTPLMMSVGRGHMTTVKLLLEAGANVMARDNNDHNALYYAQNSIVGLEYEEEIQLLKNALRKAGADIHDGIQQKNEIKKIERNENHKRKSKEGSLEKDTASIFKRETIDPMHESNVEESVNEESDIEVEEDEEIEDIKEHEEDEEEEEFITHRKRTSSPALTDRKHSSPPTDGIPESKRLKTETEGYHNTSKAPVKKVHEETTEEREQRLKAEEEYRQRKIQNKKKKEQELLHKMQEDERKREEEKVRQQIAEVKRIEEAKRKEELMIIKEKEENELIRRRQIRSLYPIGLKLIDFDRSDDFENFLPLYYYIRQDNIKYVLDLQMVVLLKGQEFEDVKDKIEVKDTEKRQLWNIYKFIFLYGGHNNTKFEEVNNKLKSIRLDTRIEYETEEFNKFSELPMHWVKWEDMDINNESQRQTFENNMVPISLHKENNMTLNNPSNRSSELTSVTVPNQKQLPVRLQHRRSIAKLLFAQQHRRYTHQQQEPLDNITAKDSNHNNEQHRLELPAIW